jgi:hypothetical protein
MNTNLKLLEDYLLMGALLTGNIPVKISSNNLRHINLRQSEMVTNVIADIQGINIDVAMRLLTEKIGSLGNPRSALSALSRGDIEASSSLDAELLEGSYFKAWHNGLKFVVVILRDLVIEPPPKVIHQVITTHSVVEWSANGRTYKTSYAYESNDQPNYSQIIKLVTSIKLNGKDNHWKYRTEKRGYGNNLEEAINAAVSATPLEEKK